MDTTPFDPTLENDIKELMKEVPPQIRVVFASGKVEIIAKNLMQKYRLHIDQGAIVEREIILLLLGLKNPTEFSQTLAEEAKLDQQTITSIVQDVNTQIFIPLRAEMMGGTEKEKQQVKPANPQLPPPSRPLEASRPPGVVAPPPQSPSYFHLDNKLPFTRPAPGTLNTGRPPTPAPPRPSVTPSVGESGGHSSLRATLAAVTAPKPESMLEDHEEPHIEFKKAPENLPGAMPPPATSRPPAPPTQYSADPYREPIE